MARGAPSPIGTVRVSQNGYHYTKTEDCWRLTHHIIAEEALGRPLHANERATFIDGDKTNLKPGNIRVVFKSAASIKKRILEIDLKMGELQYEKQQLRAKLKKIEAGELGN